MPDMNHHAAEAATTVAGKVTGGAGVGLVVYGGLTLQEWGIVAGVVIGIGGWITQSAINWYFKNQMLKLEKLRLQHDLNQTEPEGRQKQGGN